MFGQARKLQNFELITVPVLLLSLASSIPCNEITFQKDFWCSRSSEFHSNCLLSACRKDTLTTRLSWNKRNFRHCEGF